MNRKANETKQRHSPLEFGQIHNNNDKCFFDLIRRNEETYFK